jgi:hypothetical protein
VGAVADKEVSWPGGGTTPSATKIAARVESPGLALDPLAALRDGMTFEPVNEPRNSEANGDAPPPACATASTP